MPQFQQFRFGRVCTEIQALNTEVHTLNTEVHALNTEVHALNTEMHEFVLKKKALAKEIEQLRGILQELIANRTK